MPFPDIFKPRATASGDDLPVVVWIRGGGFRAGQGGDGPRAFAVDSVVVVTFNYRLDLLSFRDWPSWGQDDPRNFGQADMVKALQWVKTNIQAFGGDPIRVTITGHSVGELGVPLMMVDPRARGLFHRPIAHAGYAAWPLPRAMSPTDDERQRLRFAPLEGATTPRALVDRVPNFHVSITGGVGLPESPEVSSRRGARGRCPTWPAPIAITASGRSMGPASAPRHI